MAVYFEARGEPPLGQTAVAQVIVERSFHPDFPPDICGVVYQGRYDGRGNPLKGECHFSFWCDGKREDIRNEGAFIKAVGYSLIAFINPPLEEGTIYYHSKEVRPGWVEGLEVTATIGNHIFYKELK